LAVAAGFERKFFGYQNQKNLETNSVDLRQFSITTNYRTWISLVQISHSKKRIFQINKRFFSNRETLKALACVFYLPERLGEGK
jgi:hypothetical protein